MNVDQNRRYIESYWQDSILPSLSEYIRIPNKSPMFDPEWQAHGYMDEAVAQAAQRARPGDRVLLRLGNRPAVQRIQNKLTKEGLL